MISSKASVTRLYAHFSSPEALLSEWTLHVGRETVTLMSRRAAPVGARFLIVMSVTGTAPTLELGAEVLQCTPRSDGTFLLHVHYTALPQPALDVFVTMMGNRPQARNQRRHPRLPFQVLATADVPYSPQFWVRNLSFGGTLVQVDAPMLPGSIYPGSFATIKLQVALTSFEFRGKVAWVSSISSQAPARQRPSFGIAFTELHENSRRLLEQWLQHLSPPPPPWRALLHWGP